MTIPPGVELRGLGLHAILKFYGPITTGLKLGDGVSNLTGHAARDLQIIGTGTTTVLVDNALLAKVDRITVSGAWTDGFVFKNTWGSTFTHLATSGSGISHACFTVGPIYNANYASNWDTSNNDVSYNFIVDGSGGASSSRGAIFHCRNVDHQTRTAG